MFSFKLLTMDKNIGWLFRQDVLTILINYTYYVRVVTGASRVRVIIISNRVRLIIGSSRVRVFIYLESNPNHHSVECESSLARVEYESLLAWVEFESLLARIKSESCSYRLQSASANRWNVRLERSACSKVVVQTASRRSDRNTRLGDVHYHAYYHAPKVRQLIHLSK